MSRNKESRKKYTRSPCTHCLQPCDVGFFESLKANRDREVEEWESSHRGETLSKCEFASAFHEAWNETVTTLSTLATSFRSTEIFPLNRNAIPDSILSPADNNQREQQRFLGSYRKSKVYQILVNRSTCLIQNVKIKHLMTLEEFEATLTLEQIVLFTSRQEEGYDLLADSALKQK